MRWGVFVKNSKGEGRQLKPSYARKTGGWLRRRNAKALQRKAIRKYGKKNVTVRTQLSIAEKESLLIKRWLRGDLDFNRDLMVALARTAADLKTELYVNYGRRSYQEQMALWLKYGAGRAARPGTSNHEKGIAADVVKNSSRNVNVGDIPGAREALKKNGLCLPVAGEPWHTEKGRRWNA